MSSLSLRHSARAREQGMRLVGAVHQALLKSVEKTKARFQRANHAFKESIEADARYTKLCESFQINTRRELKPVAFLVSLSSAKILSVEEGQNAWIVAEDGSIKQQTDRASKASYEIRAVGGRFLLSSDAEEEKQIVCNESLSLGGERFLLKVIPPHAEGDAT